MPSVIIGILLAIAAVLMAIAVRHETRAICAYCGSSHCNGDPCLAHDEWKDREAEALAKLDAALTDPTDDLSPWREYLESL